MSALYTARFIPAIAAFIASVIGGYRKTEFDMASRIFWLYACIGFLVEGCALYAAMVFGNNMPIYSIYSLIEFGLIAAYFNYSVDVLRPQKIGLLIGAIGMSIGILNIIFLQPLNVLNSYYLYFEGIIIIALCMFSFFRMLLLSESLRLYKSPHFWFPVILCFFWSVTFFNWGLYGYFLTYLTEWMWLINLSINLVSGVTYLAMAVVFWNYPKLIAANE